MLVVEVTQTALQTRTTPFHAAMLFWPEFGAAVVTAIAFGAVVRTRLLRVFAFGGLAILAIGAGVLTGVGDGPLWLVPVGAGLVAVGVGASVAAALSLAGFSQRNTQIQRIFALVELLRAAAAFIAAPVILHFAKTVAKVPDTGTREAIWLCFGLVALGGLAAVGLYALGGGRPHAPDLERWLSGEGPALESPPLLAVFRGRRPALTAGEEQRAQAPEPATEPSPGVAVRPARRRIPRPQGRGMRSGEHRSGGGR